MENGNHVVSELQPPATTSSFHSPLNVMDFVNSINSGSNRHPPSKASRQFRFMNHPSDASPQRTHRCHAASTDNHETHRCHTASTDNHGTHRCHTASTDNHETHRCHTASTDNHETLLLPKHPRRVTELPYRVEDSGHVDSIGAVDSLSSEPTLIGSQLEETTPDQTDRAGVNANDFEQSRESGFYRENMTEDRGKDLAREIKNIGHCMSDLVEAVNTRIFGIQKLEDLKSSSVGDCVESSDEDSGNDETIRTQDSKTFGHDPKRNGCIENSEVYEIGPFNDIDPQIGDTQSSGHSKLILALSLERYGGSNPSVSKSGGENTVSSSYLSFEEGSSFSSVNTGQSSSLSVSRANDAPALSDPKEPTRQILPGASTEGSNDLLSKHNNRYKSKRLKMGTIKKKFTKSLSNIEVLGTSPSYRSNRSEDNVAANRISLEQVDCSTRMIRDRNASKSIFGTFRREKKNKSAISSPRSVDSILDGKILPDHSSENRKEFCKRSTSIAVSNALSLTMSLGIGSFNQEEDPVIIIEDNSNLKDSSNGDTVHDQKANAEGLKSFGLKKILSKTPRDILKQLRGSHRSNETVNSKLARKKKRRTWPKMDDGEVCCYS